MAFARLYETKELGQILVKLDQNEESLPEIRYFFEPENLGVCSMAISFKDSETAWDNAERVFDLMNEDKAIEAVSKVLDGMDL